MIEKVDQESEEYRKWKGESVPIEQPQEEEKIEELPEPKRKKIFFLDWFFGIETHRGQMVMMYYFFSFLFYYLFCVFMAYLIERIDSPELNILEILYLFLLAIPVAIILPFFLLITGFTLSGGILVGMFVGIFSWIFGVCGRFLYKIFGYDVELLFPEYIGKKGEVSKYGIFGKYTPYPYTATIKNMGLAENSIFYKNNFSVRSYEELKLGQQVEIIEHEKRSITSLIKNHPTFVVRPLDSSIILNREELNND